MKRKLETKNVVLVHGFNVKDGGKDTVDKLKPYLTDYTIQESDYGWFGFLQVRLANHTVANVIASMSLPNSVGIGHSNGCALLVKAAEKNPDKFSHLILINPALDNDVEFPECLKRIDVFYTEEDKAVWLAKFRPFHIWGDMGRVGYKGEDLRVVEWNATDLWEVTGHSDVFTKADLLGTKITQLIKKVQ